MGCSRSMRRPGSGPDGLPKHRSVGTSPARSRSSAQAADTASSGRQVRPGTSPRTGELARMTSPYGQALEIEHTPTSVAISSTQGVSLDLTFDSERVVSASSSDGRVVRYSYNDGRLVQAAAPGQTIGYRHDAAGRLVEYSLPAGATSNPRRCRPGSEPIAGSGRTVQPCLRRIVGHRDRDESLRRPRSTNTTTRIASPRAARAGEVVLVQQFDDAGRLTDRPSTRCRAVMSCRHWPSRTTMKVA